MLLLLLFCSVLFCSVLADADADADAAADCLVINVLMKKSPLL